MTLLHAESKVFHLDSNKGFTGNNSFTGPNGQKRIIVSQGISLFRRTKTPKINNSFETLIQETRVAENYAKFAFATTVLNLPSPFNNGMHSLAISLLPVKPQCVGSEWNA